MADLPSEAAEERQAIWDAFGMATIVKSDDPDTFICQSTPESSRAIRAWSTKWDVEQYGIGTPHRVEDNGDHVLSYYHLTIPPLQESWTGTAQEASTRG